MFIEELFNPTENNINNYYFENIISNLNDRVYLHDIDLNSINIYHEDEIYHNLYKAIDYDISNVDMYLGECLKNTILKFYIKMKSKDLSEDERNELKWFLVERLQGYMPYTHRVLYNM